MSGFKEPFSYDGYQIVRREMFAHLREPAMVIRTDSITFNTACINGLETAVYIHIRVNEKKRSIAVYECDEGDRNAQRWCIARPDKRKTRRITSRYFTQMIYELMQWSDLCRYKVEGEKKILGSGRIVYFFDLDKCQIIFEQKKKTKAEVLAEAGSINVSSSDIQRSNYQAGDRQGGEKPFYPADAEHSFGLPVNQQRSFSMEMIRDNESFVPVVLDDKSDM